LVKERLDAGRRGESVSVPWSLPALRREWNAAKDTAAPWRLRSASGTAPALRPPERTRKGLSPLATREDLRAALADFARRFAAEPRLKQMTQGWDRTIEVRASDLGVTERLRVEGGELTLLDGGDAPPAEIVMEAAGELLRDLFLGRISPTDPYMSGDLVLRASEQDVMRIDVITLMIWGE
jgi:hypothetical protein